MRLYFQLHADYIVSDILVFFTKNKRISFEVFLSELLLVERGILRHICSGKFSRVFTENHPGLLELRDLVESPGFEDIYLRRITLHLVH